MSDLVNPDLVASDLRDQRLADVEHLRQFASGEATQPDCRNIFVRQFHVWTKTCVGSWRDNLKVLRVHAQRYEASVMKVHSLGHNDPVGSFVGRTVSRFVSALEMNAAITTPTWASGGLVSDPDVAGSVITHIPFLPLEERVLAERASYVFRRKLGWFSATAAAWLSSHKSILSGSIDPRGLVNVGREGG